MCCVLVGGEKLAIWGVHGVHLVEIPQAAAKDDAEPSDGVPPGGLPASTSRTSSLSISTLRPRLRASAPASSALPTALAGIFGMRRSIAASSDDAMEQLGDDARVLATEPWLVLTGDRGSCVICAAGGVPVA